MRLRIIKILALFALLAGVPGVIFCWEKNQPNEAALVRAEVGQGVVPVVRGVGWVARALSHVLESVVTSGQVRERNRILEERISQLNAENAFLREWIGRYRRMGATAVLAENAGWEFVSAGVIAYGGRRSPHCLLLDRGKESGIVPGSPVLHGESLAGVVTQSDRSISMVQLLSDPQSAIGVLVLPVRAQGLVRGTGQADSLEIVLQDATIDLRPGCQVVTSGMRGSLYPRGLVVGTVGELDRNRFGQTIARVHPAVDLRRIEEVVILTKGGPDTPTARAWEAWEDRGEGDAIRNESLVPTSVTLAPFLH